MARRRIYFYIGRWKFLFIVLIYNVSNSRPTNRYTNKERTCYLLLFFIKYKNSLRPRECIKISKNFTSYRCFWIMWCDNATETQFDKIFKHVFQPCGFHGSDLKTFRKVALRHFHLFMDGMESFWDTPKIMIFRDFVPKLSVIPDFEAKIVD